MKKTAPPLYPSTEPFNFLGLDEQDYKKARVAILLVPYSSTAYWKAGTKEGPRAIIEASRHIELWDQELGQDISRVGIYTLPELEVSKNSPKETIDRVAGVLSSIHKDKKFPLMFGGEHSLALAGVMGAAKRFRNLSVLQLDAHTDSRDEFEGTRYHHGCWARRVVEDLRIHVTHIGIRSTSEEEMKFLEKSKLDSVFFAAELPIEEIISTLEENVYITIDLDVLDTGLMPSTGTPEPGGLGWYEILSLLRNVCESRNVVAGDIVELDPIPAIHAPDYLAAKLAYKLIGYVTIPRKQG